MTGPGRTWQRSADPPRASGPAHVARRAWDPVRALGNRTLAHLLRTAPAPAVPGRERDADRTAREAGAAPDGVHGFMSRRFGLDPADVELRADAGSARTAAELGARAYTVGRTVGFGAGQYRPGTSAGDQLIAHELAHVAQQERAGRPEVQLSRLRDWQGDRAAAVSDADIRGTNEYKAYLDPALVWQTVHRVTDAEAVLACRFMLTALQNGIAVSWPDSALRHLVRARTYLGRVATLAAAQETWLTAQGTAAGLTVGEEIHRVAQAGGYGGNPATWWDGLSAVDQARWSANAVSVLTGVVTSVAGTPLEALVRARGISISPRQCEVLGAFAYFSPADNKLHVGREWVRAADPAAGGDPRNVHDNIAHELGGHFEYGQYGPSMAQSIMDAVLARLSAAERGKARAGPRGVFSAYGYMETELFAELRESELRRPGSGGDPPATDVPRQLRAIRDRFAPAVAREIVLELNRRVRAATNVTPTAKTLFRNSVRTVFPGLLP